MPFDAADTAAFFDPDMPGYALATIGGGAVDGLFSNGYAEVFGGAVGGAAPSFCCATADIPTVARGTAVTIAAVAYTVVGIEPAGTGKTTLRLEAV